MASDAVVNLVVDATRAEGQINVQLRRIVDEAEARAPEINIRIDIDHNSLTTATNAITGGLNDVQSSTRDADRDSNRLLDTFGRIASSALPAAKAIGAVGLAAGGGIPLVAGLVTSLTNIAPAAAAGVSAFVTMKAATLTLKLGLTGVADALQAVFDPDADPAAVAEALERLSPEARKFVGVLQEMKPAFDALRLDVQDRLFRDLDASLQQVGKSTLPIARRAALDFADTFNQMGRGVADAADTLSREGTLGSALSSGTDAFRELEDVPGQVVLAIGRLAAAGGPLLNRLSDSISGVVDRLSTSLANASESGALEKAVNAAGDAIAQLGRIGTNVFEILGNVLGVADSSGAGLFGTLEKITQVLADATATQGFKDALTALMGVVSTLADNVLPLVGVAFEALGPVITALAPAVELILNTLGTQLLALLPKVAPILEQLGESVSNLLLALEPLIPVFFELVNALLPVLPPLFDALNEIIIALTPVIAVMATTLADTMVPAITDLIPVIVTVAQAIADWVEVLAPLAVEVLPVLLPLLDAFVVALASVLNAALPLISGLLDLALTIMDTVVTAFNALGAPVQGANDSFNDFAGGAVRGVVIPALRTLGSLLTGDFSGAWRTAAGAVGLSSSGIRSDVSSMVSSVIGYVRGLGSSVVSSFTTSFNTVVQVVSQQLSRALSSVRGFGSSVLSTIRGFSLYSSGAALISGFIDGIRSQIGRVASAASDVVSAARDFFPFSPAKKGAFSGRGWTKYSGQALISDFQSGINDRLRSFSIDWGTVGDPVLPGLGAANGGGSLTDAGGVSTLFNTAFARVTPAVNVYLGNELLTERVQVQIDNSNSARDRSAGQGVRF